ncbi:MAG: phosphotransferase [Thiotrichales bacterium]|nr:phosphotransferase [Thiotrichales bacterium]
MSSRSEQISQWLENDAGLGDARFEPASEDASFRKYFRVFSAAGTFILMDAPPDRESCEAFIDITLRLRAAGINAPEIHRQDQQQGFLLLTDLGQHQYLQVLDESNADGLYTDAIATLHRMQNESAVAGLPEYDAALLRDEMQLFSDWLLDRHLGLALNAKQAADLETVYDVLLASALEQPCVFVHRDYHSRNLMVTAEHNPGVLDYQDAVLGPVCYDIVSLLKDCYICWPLERRLDWLQRFYSGCSLLNGSVDYSVVRRWFDLMGVQRHLKASGIFCRLHHRDGKAGFLHDVPRTLAYIVELRADYPELSALCDLLETRVLPGLQQVQH